MGHLVALSVVGTDRLSDSPYFRARIAQEKLIKESGPPYSIVHATQFFEFVKTMAIRSSFCFWRMLVKRRRAYRR